MINFPTKRHWRGKSRIEDIESGLASLVAYVRTRGIRSIAIPPLGCGLGGLDWTDVRPRIERALAAVPEVKVLLLEPSGAPSTDQMVKSSHVPKMTSGRAVLEGLIDRYLAGLLDPAVSLLEVHKLMYFTQEAGQVLSVIEGHLISGYADGGDAPDKQLELVPGAITDAAAFLEGQPETRARFDRVGKLVEGFETAFGLELLSTVHWLSTREKLGREAVVAGVHAWGDRKRQFSPRQILLARDILAAKGWLDVIPTAA